MKRFFSPLRQSGDRQQLVSLFGISFLFMFMFQLFTRLTEYTFMFHQGVLLLSSCLLGAGLLLIGIKLLSQSQRTSFVQFLPVALLGSWLLYLLAFLTTQDLLIHFVLLTVLFGVLFLLITQKIHLQPNHFAGVELAGSFCGVAGLVILSYFVLEEWLILGVTVVILAYCLCTRLEQDWGSIVKPLACRYGLRIGKLQLAMREQRALLRENALT